jgi:hypothetical protein
MSIRGRLATTLLRAIQKILNRNVNVGDIQGRYNATKGRVLRIYIEDTDTYANFKIENGQVELIHCDNPNATVRMSLDTMLFLIKGSMDVKEQDGAVVNQTYTPFDAWRRGELIIQADNPNEGWLSDLTLFGKEIYQEAFPIIRTKLGGVLKT